MKLFLKPLKPLVVVALATALWGCTEKHDKTIDRGFDSKSLTQLQAGIWVDPNGCDHWIIDDGIEGYLSPRLDRSGKPVCSDIAAPSTAVGPFKNGSIFHDPI